MRIKEIYVRHRNKNRAAIDLFQVPFFSGSISFPVNRYIPLGTVISNRAPFPGSPLSSMVILVIARISRIRNNP